MALVPITRYLLLITHQRLRTISPVGSGANFSGLPPGGASRFSPASLPVSPRLLLSVVAFELNGNS